MSVSQGVDDSLIKPLKIDVVSDVMCPWCYIGKRRLEQALAITEEVRTDVEWHPFQLDPTLPAEGKDRQQYLREKFGGAEQAATVYQRVQEAGDAEQIPFAFDRIEKSPNTLDSHRVLRWARVDGRQDQVLEALFRAYFVDGRDLTDPDVLADIAAEGGMDREVVVRLLATDADLAETEAAVVHAQAIGVTGVPTFILDGKYAVSGAQPPDVLANALRQVEAERHGGPLPAP